MTRFIINSLAKFNFNLKHVDHICIKIYGEQCKYKTTKYSANIYFSNNNLNIDKRINSNNYDELIERIKNTIDYGVKL